MSRKNSRPAAKRPPRSALTTPAAPVTVTFHGLAAGGDAVARHEGLVIFVPFGLPGEEARVLITEQRPTLARGRIVEILQPSPERVAAACRHFGECGGCTWQQMDYAAQLRAKTDLVRTQLARVAGLPDVPVRECLPSPQPYGYRNRARLAVLGDGRVGYRAAASHTLVAVQECPILEPGLEQQLGALVPPPGRDEVTLRVPMRPMRVGDEEYLVSDGSFFQVNTRQAAALVRLVLDALALRGSEAVLDLYCGVGLFTLPIARRAAFVLGVEIEGSSVHDAGQNLVGLPHAELLLAPVEQALHDERVLSRRWDAVVLDPPRRGVDRPALERIAALDAPAIVYVSCDPATLARDLRLLAEHGYGLLRAQPVDMFPQTAHVETVVLLRRDPSPPIA